MSDDLLTILVPMLADRPGARFNVFDVMHHGTHEKQLSNVFAWLLKPEATHGLGDAFQRLFVELVNKELVRLGRSPLAPDAFGVRQEVQTAVFGQPHDIADIVLDGEHTTIVVENYWTSDGHGHSYDGYFAYGAAQTPTSVVVLLCETKAESLLTEGWNQAPVLLYSSLLEDLYALAQSLTRYRQDCVEQFYFIENMHRHFTNRMALNMDRDGLVGFMDALCRGGEAEKFGWNAQDDVARQLGDRLREEAIQRYTESRDLLGRAKVVLRDYCAAILARQLNAALGETVYGTASLPWRGQYQWTVVMGTHEQNKVKQLYLQLGPSAWYSLRNPSQPGWGGGGGLDPAMAKSVLEAADYTRIQIATRGGRVRQSEVTLVELLGGLTPDDTRLRDEIVELLA